MKFSKFIQFENSDSFWDAKKKVSESSIEGLS